MSAIDTSHLIPDLRELVRVALELGWTARMGTNRKTVMLRSHDGKKTLAVDPINSINARLLQQKQRTVTRYADKVKLAVLEAAMETPALMRDLKGVAAEAAVYSKVHDGLPITLGEALDAQESSDTLVVDSGIVEVSRRPWQARRQSAPGGGTVYDSDAVVEVRFSDGSVNYECALGCGYSHATNPRSVATHYGKGHTAKGDAVPARGGQERIDPTYTEPLTHRDYTPTERLVRLLQHAIEEAMEGSWNTRDLAVSILRWQHDRVGEGGEPGPSVPLTDSQIVERIRLMLDTGESVAQQQEIDELRAAVSRETEERLLSGNALLLMEQRAVKAETALSALAELATDAARAS